MLLMKESVLNFEENTIQPRFLSTFKLSASTKNLLRLTCYLF